MPRGDARGRRSGPPPDPKSARSEKLGRHFGKLPAAGHSGRVPAWPLSTKASASERRLWNEVWRTPQATAWATEPWRRRTVATYVRLQVQLEQPGAPVGLTAAVARWADQIGLTPSGLLMNGWEIEEAPRSKGAVAEEAAPKAAPVPPDRVPLKQRLQVVPGGS